MGNRLHAALRARALLGAHDGGGALRGVRRLDGGCVGAHSLRRRREREALLLGGGQTVHHVIAGELGVERARRRVHHERLRRDDGFVRDVRLKRRQFIRQRLELALQRLRALHDALFALQKNRVHREGRDGTVHRLGARAVPGLIEPARLDDVVDDAVQRGGERLLGGFLAKLARVFRLVDRLAEFVPPVIQPRGLAVHSLGDLVQLVTQSRRLLHRLRLEALARALLLASRHFVRVAVGNRRFGVVGTLQQRGDVRDHRSRVIRVRVRVTIHRVFRVRNRGFVRNPRLGLAGGFVRRVVVRLVRRRLVVVASFIFARRRVVQSVVRVRSVRSPDVPLVRGGVRAMLRSFRAGIRIDRCDGIGSRCGSRRAAEAGARLGARAAAVIARELFSLRAALGAPLRDVLRVLRLARLAPELRASLLALTPRHARQRSLRDGVEGGPLSI